MAVHFGGRTHDIRPLSVVQGQRRRLQRVAERRQVHHKLDRTRHLAGHRQEAAHQDLKRSDHRAHENAVLCNQQNALSTHHSIATTPAHFALTTGEPTNAPMASPRLSPAIVSSTNTAMKRTRRPSSGCWSVSQYTIAEKLMPSTIWMGVVTTMCAMKYVRNRYQLLNVSLRTIASSYGTGF